MTPKARFLLDAADVDAYVTTNVTDALYATGVHASSCVLLTLPKGHVLFTDARYGEAAKRDARKGIVVRDIATLDRALSRVKRCAFDDEEMTLARLKRWKKRFASTAFTASKNIFFEARRVKSDEEIRFLRRALRITDDILKHIPSLLKNGVTEREIAWKIESMARDLGAEGLSFDAIVAFGTHTSRPHHHPTARRFKKGDLVQIDTGAKYRGYCGDRSEVFFTARPTDRQSFVSNAVREAKDVAKKHMFAGAHASKPDGVARDVLKRHGLEKHFTHALGHGVGLEVHEGVTISSKSKMTFLSGEVVTAEPGVYLEGLFGMRLEDMVFIA